MTRKALFIGILSFFICLILMGHLWASWQTTDIVSDSYQKHASSLMATDSNNKVHMVYSAEISNNPYVYVLRYVTNKTGSWNTYTLRVDCPSNYGCTLPAIIIGPDDYIHVVYEKVWGVYPRPDQCSYCTEGQKAIMYLKFRDNNGTLEYVANEAVYQYLADTTYFYPLSVTLDRNNKVHIAFLYCAWNPIGDWLYYATNAFGGWSVENVPASYGWAGISPSIGVDSSGYVHISHVDWYWNFSSYGNLWYSRKISGSWYSSILADDGYHTSTSLDIDSGNSVHISYNDIINDKFKYTTSKNGFVQQIIDNTSYDVLGTYDTDPNDNSIAIDSNNNAHIAYNPYANGEKIRYATNKSGSWIWETVDSFSSYHAQMPSIAIGKTGSINISYFYNNYTLRYATTDSDNDGTPDNSDNCLYVYNPDQKNSDYDSIGDACDTCTDTDGDGYGNPGYPANTCMIDNCPTIYNPDQKDTDGDGVGDACDTCTDTDRDGYGNPGYPANTCMIDNCPNVYNPDQADTDGDGVANACDNCPNVYNPDQADTDGDGIGNACDNCPNVYNPDQKDADKDSIGDICDTCTDTDGDGYGNPGYPANTCPNDNSPIRYNPSQLDTDGDGVGDASDSCSSTLPVRIARATPVYFSTLQEAYNSANDGDIIQIHAERLYQDFDANLNISVTLEGGFDCGFTTIIGNTMLVGMMTINDGVVEGGSFVLETLKDDYEPLDADGDGIPDSFEVQFGLNPNDPNDAGIDSDSDGFTNLKEYQSGTNPKDSDTDDDGVPDVTDNCPNAYNLDQRDTNNNGIGDACDSNDSDNDGIPDYFEYRYGLNPADPADAGYDNDNDGLTNLQEYQKGTNPTNSDTDGDGILDGADTCPITLPVKINTTYYSSLQDAYNAAGGGTIQSQDEYLSQSITLNLPKSVTLQGGYDCNYTSVSGQTKLKGQIRISDGTVTVRNFRLVK